MDTHYADFRHHLVIIWVLTNWDLAFIKLFDLGVGLRDFFFIGGSATTSLLVSGDNFGDGLELVIRVRYRLGHLNGLIHGANVSRCWRLLLFLFLFSPFLI